MCIFINSQPPFKPKQMPNLISKTCKTCDKEFFVPNQERTRKRIYCSKSCKNQDPIIKSGMIQKQKETFLKKYGGHPMTTDSTKENFKKSMFEKYGVENALSNKGLMAKVGETKLERYGNKKYNNIEKMKETFMKNYGVDNPCKRIDIKEKIRSTLTNNNYDNLLFVSKERKLSPLFNREDYSGYTWENKYMFKCDCCSNKFETTIYNHKTIFCPTCNPTGKNIVEQEIYEFISTLIPTEAIKISDRTVLVGKELDFYVKDKKIAIEHNGLYWHAENANGKDKLYHLNKTKSCAFHGIRLIHIFEDEWTYKKTIVKSIIKNQFGLFNKKIHGRDCTIKEVSPPEKNKFLEENHIQGGDKSSIKIGLYLGDELVSIMTFGISRFDKNVQYEMFRFCNKLGYKIHGGASKMFSYFVKKYSPQTIISYSDRRYFTGEIYGKLGFSLNNITPPNYYYIEKNYKSRLGRMNFQKHKLKDKLKIYDESLSEWENMKNNGYDRIWDCGNIKWIWKNEKDN